MRLTDHVRRIARKWQTRATDLIVLLAFGAICAAMLMTVGDIILRLSARAFGAVFGDRPRWELFGLVDLTQLAIMTAAPLAIAAAFFSGAHIRVDLVLENLKRPARATVLRLSGLIGAALMGLCLWTAWAEMRAQLDFTTTSATLGIPYTWYWLPLIAGLGLSMLGTAVAFLWPESGRDDDA